MKEWLLDLIDGELKFPRFCDDEIWSGIIICKNFKFGISKGIPSFIPRELYKQYKRIKAYYESLPVLSWPLQNEYIRYMRKFHLMGLNHLIELLTTKSQEVKILCLGCGWGFEVFCLAELLKRKGVSFKIIGIDLARKPLIYARKLAKKLGIWIDIDFAVGVGEYLPFKSHSLDAVTAIFGPMDHSLHYAHVFAEVWRILKPGGLFLATFLNKFSFSTLVSIIKSPRFALKLVKNAPQKFAFITVRGFRIPTHFWNPLEISYYTKKLNMQAIDKIGIFCLLPTNFKREKMSKFHKLLAFIDTYSARIIWFLGRYMLFIFKKNLK